jgi:hypothetical protein
MSGLSFLSDVPLIQINALASKNGLSFLSDAVCWGIWLVWWH